MKKALIDSKNNRVVEICNVGAEFETHKDLYWVNCPDDIETFFKYDPDTLTFEDPHALEKDDFGNMVEPFFMQRSRAYPSGGDQMDMLWRELRDTGTISRNGEFYRAIQAVKEGVPKPDGLQNYDDIPEELEQLVDGTGKLVKIYYGVNATTNNAGIGAEFKIRLSESEGHQVAIQAPGQGYKVNDTLGLVKAGVFNISCTVTAVNQEGQITKFAKN